MKKPLKGPSLKEQAAATHGGKRKGSGRPKGEPTKTMRVPVSKVEEVKSMIAKKAI